MTERIVGLIIKKYDYQEFDEIITVLTDNEILSFIAMGVRKMKSKNRMSLQKGNIIEAEIFRARLKGKVSKLKTSTLIVQPPIQTSDTAAVLLEIINNLNKIDRTNTDLFKAIISTYSYFGEEYNHHIKTYIAFKELSPLGLIPRTNGCVICNRRDRIIEFNFDMGGFLCALHFKNETPILELKAFSALNLSFSKYKKTDFSTNKIIYLKLKNYLDKNTIY